MNTNTHALVVGGGRSEGNGSGELVLIDARNGEVMDDLSRYDPDLLAAAFVLIKERKAELEAARKALDAELRRRVHERGTRYGAVWVTGDHELKIARESEWDADELEGVLRALVDDGELTPRDVLGVITHEPKVNKTNAGRLLDRLDGDAHAQVKACRTWRDKSLQVARSLPLLPEN